MIKFIWLLALVVIAWRLIAGRWPWGRIAGQGAALAKARNLLGVPSNAGRDDVIEAHRRLITQVHPDRGGSNEAVHEANAARDLLLGALAANKSEPR